MGGTCTGGRSGGLSGDADRGATAVEYALILALVGLVVTAALIFAGGALADRFGDASAAVAGQPLTNETGEEGDTGDTGDTGGQGGTGDTPLSCPGQGDSGQANKKGNTAATCNTSTGEWECPTGFDLTENGNSNKWFCEGP